MKIRVRMADINQVCTGTLCRWAQGSKVVTTEVVRLEPDHPTKNPLGG